MKLMIVGEYLSEQDAEAGGPFRSGLGKMFKVFLRQVGIEPRECLFTNVIMEPPKGKKSMFGYTGPKDKGIPNMKFLARGHYVRAEFRPHIERLWKLINREQPNLILAVGDMALWALTSEYSIKNTRGRIHLGNSAIPGRKVLPVYSPRQINIDYSQRPVLLADLTKARREQEFPEVRRPQRFIHLYPNLQDLDEFFQEYIYPSKFLDIDIETKGPVITCVGFAPSSDRALVVPFFTEANPSGNYWETAEEEIAAWRWVEKILASKRFSVCGQNFQFDMQYLLRQMGIPSPSFSDDTMLMQHSLQPEMQKGLGFLASIYTDELPWKFMHKVSASAKGTKKGDDG